MAPTSLFRMNRPVRFHFFFLNAVEAHALLAGRLIHVRFLQGVAEQDEPHHPE